VNTIGLTGELGIRAAGAGLAGVSKIGVVTGITGVERVTGVAWANMSGVVPDDDKYGPALPPPGSSAYPPGAPPPLGP